MAWFPWEEGFKWPWETVYDTTTAFIDGIVRLTVGGILALIGILILTGLIQMPGGWLVRLLSGFLFVLGGLGIVLGWFAGWF